MRPLNNFYSGQDNISHLSLYTNTCVGSEHNSEIHSHMCCCTQRIRKKLDIVLCLVCTECPKSYCAVKYHVPRCSSSYSRCWECPPRVWRHVRTPFITAPLVCCAAAVYRTTLRLLLRTGALVCRIFQCAVTFGTHCICMLPRSSNVTLPNLKLIIELLVTSVSNVSETCDVSGVTSGTFTNNSSFEQNVR
jgi:hypothetical protein